MYVRVCFWILVENRNPPGPPQVSQLTEVLVALCEVADASELDKGFTDRAFRAADRDSGARGVEVLQDMR